MVQNQLLLLLLLRPFSIPGSKTMGLLVKGEEKTARRWLMAMARSPSPPSQLFIIMIRMGLMEVLEGEGLPLSGYQSGLVVVVIEEEGGG